MGAGQRALSTGDVLEPGGERSRNRPSTNRILAAGYGRWLTFLRSRSELEPGVPPGAGITRERMSAYLTELQTQVATATRERRIVELRLMAELLDPAGDWRWLRRLALPCPARRPRWRRPQEPATQDATVAEAAQAAPLTEENAMLDQALAAPAAMPRPSVRDTAAAILAAWDDEANREGDMIGAMDAPMEALRTLLANKPARVAREPGAPRKPREGTKQDQVLAMLRRPEGATVAQTCPPGQ